MLAEAEDIDRIMEKYSKYLSNESIVALGTRRDIIKELVACIADEIQELANAPEPDDAENLNHPNIQETPITPDVPPESQPKPKFDEW